MHTIEVSISHLRRNLKAILDQVDTGTNIVLSRGGNKKYYLQRLEDPTSDFTPEVHTAIRKAMEDIKQGKGTRVEGASGVKEFFENL